MSIAHTPTSVGYDAAAFYRYRVSYGADQSKKIEWNPSWQWDGYGYGAVFVLIKGNEDMHDLVAKIMLARSKGFVE